MKIAIYADQDVFERGVGDTSYLYDALSSSFDVSLHWEADTDLCRDADVVFCRFTRARPTPRKFLSRLARQRDKLMVNDPRAILRFGTKRHLLHFPHLTAPTLISRSRSEILAFAREHGTIVLKPLDGHWGKGAVRISAPGLDDEALWTRVRDHIEQHGTPVVQRYIDRVSEWGNKRINVVGYQAISAMVSLPAEGCFICHRSAGGREVPAPLTRADAEIVRQLMPFLKSNGIWWAGIDLIGPYLGEINVSSPAAIRRADIAHDDSRGIEAFMACLNEHRESHGL